MKKIFTTLFAALFGVATISAQNITFDWAIGGGGADADRASVMGNDALGNVYAGGVYQGEASFAGVALSGAAKGSGANLDNNLFLVKLKNDKTVLWTIYSNVGVVNPTGVTTTSTGDVILVGNVRAVKGGATASASIVDASGVITSFNNLDDTNTVGFIAKFDASGNIVWANSFTSTTGKNDITDVITDNENNIYVSGNFSKDITLPGGSQLTTANATQAAYVAKLNGSTENQMWIKKISGGLKNENFNALATDGSAVYVTGILTNQTTPISVTLDSYSVTPSIYPDPVVLKLDKDGNVAYFQIRHHQTASGNTQLKDFTYDNGNLYLSGNFKGNLAFASGNITSATNLNGFVAKFDAATGSDVWQKTVSSPAITEISSIAVGDDKICAFGYFYNKVSTNVGSADFGNGISITTGDANTLGDLFFAFYDKEGVIQRAEVLAQGTAAETSLASTFVNDDIYFFGSYRSTPLTLFGTIETVSTLGGFDALLLKYTIENFSTSLENVQQDNKSFKAYGLSNQLVIEGDTDTDVYVYNVYGQLVTKTYLTNGKQTIDLSKGLYIVNGKKVIVY